MSLDEEGKAGHCEVLCTFRWMMKDMKKFYQRGGLGLTYSAENVGDDVRVTSCKKGGTRKVKQKTLSN